MKNKPQLVEIEGLKAPNNICKQFHASEGMHLVRTEFFTELLKEFPEPTLEQIKELSPTNRLVNTHKDTPDNHYTEIKLSDYRSEV